MNTTIDELMIEHVPVGWEHTLDILHHFEHEDWVEYADDGELIGFICYFKFDDFKDDLILTAAKDNKFSRLHWKIVMNTTKNRECSIRIPSDPTNKTIRRLAESYGGYWVDEEIYLPYPWR